MSSKEHVHFLDYSFMSNFLSVSVTGFILADVRGTESPKAFKKEKSKKMHKLL